MNNGEKPFFIKIKNLPTLSECVIRWNMHVEKILQWEKIGIDDYFLYLYCRERIADLLETEILSTELMEQLEYSDNRFKEITEEVEKSVISSVKSDELNKRKYWFAFRLPISHYKDWISYARF